MFKVVPDQLRVSEGWVRCGQCSEIFDATQNMLPPVAPEASVAQPIAASTGAPAPTSTPPAAPVAPAAALQAVPDPAPASPLPTDAASAPMASVAPVAKPGTTDSPIADPDPRPLSPQPDRVVLTAPGVAEPMWTDAPQTDPQTALIGTPADATDPFAAHARRDSIAPETAARVHDADAGMPRVSFLQGNNAPSFWQRRVTRIVLLVLLLVLLAALAAQILASQRDRIAALEPGTRPMLMALCAWQGCSVAPLRQIESVVIDSSSFSRIRGDDYRLGFSLKNTAPIDIAMPAIELALTDPQDQAIIRRVILPAEFGAVSASLTRASVWNGSLALNVKPVANSDRIAGYRLLAFYP